MNESVKPLKYSRYLAGVNKNRLMVGIIKIKIWSQRPTFHRYGIQTSQNVYFTDN